jgi:hypothetical protein
VSKSMLKRVQTQLAKQTKAELLAIIARQEHRIQLLQQLPELVPTTWLDSLLTGPEAVWPVNCTPNNRHVEALLRGIQDRQRARVNEIGYVIRRHHDA